MKIKLNKWQRPTMCLKCNTLIMSSYRGEFVSCECGAIYCDQTEHYSKYGGNHEDFWKFHMPQDKEEQDADIPV